LNSKDSISAYLGSGGVECSPWDGPALDDAFCCSFPGAVGVSFCLSEAVGSLNVFAGSLGGNVHCGLGSGLLDAGLNAGGGRAALDCESVEVISLEPMDPLRASPAACFFRGADEISAASRSLPELDSSRARFDLVGWVAYTAPLRCLLSCADPIRSLSNGSDNWDVSRGRFRFGPARGSGTVAEPAFAACAFSLLMTHLRNNASQLSRPKDTK
jgi:hypothetical protein